MYTSSPSAHYAMFATTVVVTALLTACSGSTVDAPVQSGATTSRFVANSAPVDGTVGDVESDLSRTTAPSQGCPALSQAGAQQLVAARAKSSYPADGIDHSKSEAKLKARAEEAKSLMLKTLDRSSQPTAEDMARLDRLEELKESAVFSKHLLEELGKTDLARLIKTCANAKSPSEEISPRSSSPASEKTAAILGSTMNVAATKYPKEFGNDYLADLISVGQGLDRLHIAETAFCSGLANILNYTPKQSIVANHVATLAFDKFASDFHGVSHLEQGSTSFLSVQVSRGLLAAALSRLSPEQIRRIVAPGGMTEPEPGSHKQILEDAVDKNPRLEFATSMRNHPALQVILYNALATGSMAPTSIEATKFASFVWTRAAEQSVRTGSMVAGVRRPLGLIADSHALAVYHGLASKPGRELNVSAYTHKGPYPYHDVTMAYFAPADTEVLIQEVLRDKTIADEVHVRQLSVMTDSIKRVMNAAPSTSSGALMNFRDKSTVHDMHNVQLRNAKVGGKLSWFLSGAPEATPEWTSGEATTTSHVTAIEATASDVTSGPTAGTGPAVGTVTLGANAAADYLIWDELEGHQHNLRDVAVLRHRHDSPAIREKANVSEATLETLAILTSELGQRKLAEIEARLLPKEGEPRQSDLPPGLKWNDKKLVLDPSALNSKTDHKAFNRFFQTKENSLPLVSEGWSVENRNDQFKGPEYLKENRP